MSDTSNQENSVSGASQGLRIMWISPAIWSASGYGVQTKQTVPRLAAMPEVEYIGIAAHTGLQYGGITSMGIDHYPCPDIPRTDYTLRRHMMAARCSFAISMCDLWTLSTDFNGDRAFNFIPYVPVDAGPLSLENFVHMNRASSVLVNSRWGLDIAQEAGIKNIAYIPHMVDTRVFRPMPDKIRCKKLMGYTRDTFLVGMVGANKGRMMISRKGFEFALRAFARFAEKHDEAKIYIHGALQSTDPDTVDLYRVISAYGLEDKVRGLDAYTATLGLDEQVLATIYNAFDVMLAPSLSESVNVPVLEAQACGVPVIANRTTGLTEHIGSGWIVEPKTEIMTPQATYWNIPDWEAIAHCLEVAYTAVGTKKGRKDYAKKARRFAEFFDSDRVARDYWQPFMQTLLKAWQTSATTERPAMAGSWAGVE